MRKNAPNEDANKVEAQVIPLYDDRWMVVLSLADSLAAASAAQQLALIIHSYKGRLSGTNDKLLSS